MTVSEAISMLDALKPNHYTTANKISWLQSLDHKLYLDVICTHDLLEGESFEAPDYPGATTPGDCELLVADPYAEDLYYHWLAAKVDENNMEIGQYNQSIALWNQDYDIWSGAWHRSHRPKGNKTRVRCW